MPLLQLFGITKKYGSRIILDKFSLDVDEGEFIALTGPSGCGKSTLLNILGLLEDFDDGEFIIDGQSGISPGSAKANKILREKICYLFQNFALVDDETVGYNLNLALRYVKGSRSEKRGRMENALKLLGLEGYEKRRIYELSGGEQQRIALARIILKPCKLILADEPTGSLDDRNRDIILDMLMALNNQGKTIILVTHDKNVAAYCRRIIDLPT
jgi:putative ABC transport system ATP-binding protein